MSKWNPEKLKNHKGMLGKKHSFETIQKMMGENNNARKPEARLKISRALSGIKRTPEQIEKNRNAHLGKRASTETRLKMSESAKKNVAGGKHHLWRGGVAKLHKTERDFVEMTIEYRLWRETVLKRDNYTCKECGARGGQLHVDHIKPFALFPELRVALDNGRTLCVPCHRKTPTYGLRVFKITKAT